MRIADALHILPHSAPTLSNHAEQNAPLADHLTLRVSLIVLFLTLISLFVSIPSMP